MRGNPRETITVPDRGSPSRVGISVRPEASPAPYSNDGSARRGGAKQRRIAIGRDPRSRRRFGSNWVGIASHETRQGVMGEKASMALSVLRPILFRCRSAGPSGTALHLAS